MSPWWPAASDGSGEREKWPFRTPFVPCEAADQLETSATSEVRHLNGGLFRCQESVAEPWERGDEQRRGRGGGRARGGWDGGENGVKSSWNVLEIIGETGHGGLKGMQKSLHIRFFLIGSGASWNSEWLHGLEEPNETESKKGGALRKLQSVGEAEVAATVRALLTRTRQAIEDDIQRLGSCLWEFVVILG